MRNRLSRRQFLKTLSAAAAFAAARRSGMALAQGADHADELISYGELFPDAPMFGRVHGAAWIRKFAEPLTTSSTVGRYEWGQVMPLYRSVISTPYDDKAQSPIWFETEGGYVHSAYVPPTREQFHEPIEIPSGGFFWGEITVPFAWQHTEPRLSSYRYDYHYYQLYFGQVYKITEVAEDEEGRTWYRLFDDQEETRRVWALARNIRYIHPDEFKPISPHVRNKRLLITLSEQSLTCYEGDLPVFKTRIASGSSFQDDEGNEVDFSTPHGAYAVQRKRPSRRMRGNTGTALEYDVNAVPWVTYFDFTGAAIHGAYWHNNFGRPRSHGCINVTPDAGKWIYRWTAPHGGYDDEYFWTEPGEEATPIEIIG